MHDVRSPQTGRLDVAAFLERQRAGSLAGGAMAELVGGVLRAPALPSAEEVAAIVGLALRLEQAPTLMYGIHLKPPLHLGPAHLLRPDLALIEEKTRFGATTTYDPAQVGLVVEVVRGGDTLDLRLPAFARGRVPEVWLLDLKEGWVEVYRSPTTGRYGSRTLWYPGEALAALATPHWPVTLLEAGGRTTRT